MVGAAISAGLNLVGGLAKFGMARKLARQQMERSNKLRGEASAVKKPAIRPEYEEALTGSKLRTLTGLPNAQGLKDEADLDMATNLGRGQGIASSGGELLQYAASLGSKANKIKRGIDTQSMQMRDTNYGNYLNNLNFVGQEESRMEDIKRAKQADLMRQASALEDASTANRYEGGRSLIGDITSTGGSLLGMLGNANKMKGSSGGSNVTPITATTPITQSTIQPKTNLAPNIDSRGLLSQGGLNATEMAAVKQMLADNPNMSIEEAIQLYRNLTKF